jgi:hypothetical protein
MSDINNITHRHYDPVGRCIYCPGTDGLTEEHVVPYAIAGRAVLPDASCPDCSTETGKMEQHCCHTMLNRMRFHLRMRSRKHGRKLRPIKFTFLDENDVQRTIEIPVEENPLGLLLPTFPPMRLLTGAAFSEPQIGHWRYGPSDEVAQELMRKHAAKSASTDIDPLAFGRLIAKIGFAFAAAEVGVENFTPMITDLILGKTTDWNRLVGGQFSQVPRQSSSEIHTMLLENHDIGQQTYLIASVCLFSRFGAPSYSAALGTVSDEQYQGMLVREANRAPKFGKAHGRSR